MSFGKMNSFIDIAQIDPIDVRGRGMYMRMSADDFWLTPIGLFLDLWACHKQFMGMEKAHRELTIDDVVLV